jgi:deazaflavin-dependent oxidoreductase (nitroreductase family)
MHHDDAGRALVELVDAEVFMKLSTRRIGRNRNSVDHLVILLSRLGRARPGARWRKLILRSDRLIRTLSDGRASLVAFVGLRALTLEVNTQAPKCIPLQYVCIGDGKYIVGSNWGRRQHPKWTETLLAQPHCVANIRGTRYSVKANLLDGEERRQIWKSIIVISPHWEEASRASGRTLRIFELVPFEG